MSTEIVKPVPLETKREREAISRSLSMPTQKFFMLDRTPTLQEINKWMLEVTIDANDLRPYIGFKVGNYSRHRVVRSDYAELLVLCWRPGQRTPIHDHNGSFGAVRVCQWDHVGNYLPA